VVVTSVAVCIASIPPRRELLLPRAIQSALHQSRPADELHVAVDLHHQGEAPTRNRVIAAAQTEWVAILDDDDEFNFDHLEAMLGHADLTGADVVYSWYDVIGGTDPHPHVFGKDWDPHHPVQTTVTLLWRRSLLEHLGGFRPPPPEGQVDEHGNRDGPDFDIVKRANACGAKIAHLPQRTWRWHHHGTGRPGVPGNTSGLPDRW
jgi:glycosyltransferase involved in cell wall biosynthesis